MITSIIIGCCVGIALGYGIELYVQLRIRMALVAAEAKRRSTLLKFQRNI